MLHPFFCGVLMGAADLIPGISGGTVAFALGIYETLIGSITALNKRAFREVNFRFLFLLLLGMLTSFLTLSQGIHALLQGEATRTLLQALFSMCIAGSVFFCARRLSQWRKREYGALALGASVSYALAFLPPMANGTPSAPFLICAGALAVCAMLLPGISGSALLCLLGVYPHAIKALATFDFYLLGHLALGIVSGGILFSRTIQWLLTHYHTLTIATLIGFMIGGMQMPFALLALGALLRKKHPVQS